MILNLKPKSTVSASAFFIALFLLFPLFSLSALEIVEIPYTDELIKLEENYDSILDTAESKRCTAYTDKEKTVCDVYEDVVLYLYKTEIIPSETVVNKNTVQISDNTYKIYGSDAFYQDEQTSTWKQTEFGTIEKNDFNAVQEDRLKSIDTIIRLNNPFHIYSVNAQIWSMVEDGRIISAPGSATWSVMRDATSGTSVVVGTAGGGIGVSKNSSGYFQGIRGYYYFSMAGFTDACVSSSTFSFYTGTVTNQDNDGNDFYTVVDNSAGMTLETTDWDATTFTEYIDSSQRFDMTGKSAARYAMKLNQNATSTMTADDYFYLMVIEGHDFLNDPYAGSNNTYNETVFYCGEEAGLTKDPYLLITTEECEEEEPVATSTPFEVDSLPDLPLVDDLTVITGRTEHYETSTTPDWIEYHYYRIPFFLWYIFYSLSIFILGFLVIEIKRILKKKHESD